MRNLFFLLLLTPLLWSQALEKVKLQLQWKHQFEFAGFYAAVEKGYYKEAGLDVELIEYHKHTNITQDVIDKKVAYGVSYSSIVADYLEGKPLVFVANFFKHSPLALITQPDIKHPSDLKGKKIMGVRASIESATILLMLNKFGLTQKDFMNVPPSFKTDEFIKKEVDAMTIFKTNETFYLDEKGIKYNLLNPASYGAEFYDINLFTSLDELENHPDRVLRMKEASIKGWRYALEHKEEIVNLILKKYNSQNKSKKALMYEAIQVEGVVLPTIYPLGSIDLARVRAIAENYIALKFLPQDQIVDLKKFVFSPNTSINFSDAELHYMKNKKKLRVCVDPDWMPFESIKEGKHIGIAADFLEKIAPLLPLKFQLYPTRSWNESIQAAQERKCDMLSLASRTPSRELYMDFTHPYIDLPIVIATKMDKPFIADFPQILDKKVGIVKGYSLAEVMRKKYPHVNIVDVSSASEGLAMVERGELYGYADNLVVVAEQIQKAFTGELKISARLPESLPLSIATRNDEALLNTIFNKVIKSVQDYEIQSILNRWISVQESVTYSYTLLFKIIAIILFVLLILVINHMILRKKVKKAIKENTVHNNLLYQQSKAASLGEMIGIIAHQWRQPLAKLGAINIYLQATSKDPIVQKKLENVEETLDFMSQTINNFQNFYKQESQDTLFNVYDAIYAALEIVQGSIKTFHITISENVDKSIMLKGHSNQLSQIILAILQNMITIFKERTILDPHIHITLHKEHEKVILEISDNGHGINQNPINSIFDPYISGSHISSGIGLYMAKKIMEDKFFGTIEASNVDDGAVFIMRFK